MRRARRVQDDEVGRGADTEVTDVLAAECQRSPARRTPQGLVEIHAHVAHGDRQHEAHAGHVGGPRVAVRRHGDDAPTIEQSSRRRVVGARREIGTGQQRRHGRRRLELLDVVVAQVRAVIDTRRVEVDRQCDAAVGPS